MMETKEVNQLYPDKIEVTSVPVEALERHFDIGKIGVCSKCGQWAIKGKSCECLGTGITTLKKFVEEVRKEVFDERQWSITSEDIVSCNNGVGFFHTAEIYVSRPEWDFSATCPKCNKTVECFLNVSYYDMWTVRCLDCDQEWDYVLRSDVPGFKDERKS